MRIDAVSVRTRPVRSKLTFGPLVRRYPDAKQYNGETLEGANIRSVVTCNRGPVSSTWGTSAGSTQTKGVLHLARQKLSTGAPQSV